MRYLYPLSRHTNEVKLAVDETHTLFIREYGNPDGVPVVFLHGGPGAGCEAYHSQLFNPDYYRIILFDQRGCGLSTPHASLENNTTQDLIADLEKMREVFEIEKWVVFGGSWGSTLALAYAQAHPNVVSGLIVRGIFLGSDEEVQWFYQEGTNQFFPDFWEDFIELIPEEERVDMLHAYHRRLTGENEIAQMQAARAWALWEAQTASLEPNPSLLEHFGESKNALSIARIETHYFVNQCFLAPNQLLENMDKIKDIPGYIIHGRYDMICRYQLAYELHKHWADSKLVVAEVSGHAASEKAILLALIEATDDMLEQIK